MAAEHCPAKYMISYQHKNLDRHLIKEANKNICRHDMPNKKQHVYQQVFVATITLIC